ncbi:DivIVA domain-containing protein [Arthrobacter sp. KK5.5]|uniref:DivIVA domain-containing protein n=1 Tax=Arthrobacter sp. KK5.5 TaxID=3373084 RepID=UPI003EE45204
MEFVLVVVAVVVAGLAVLLAVGGRRGGRAPGPAPFSDGELLGLAEPLPNLPPVLLPERPTAVDVARVRFGVGLRGYRCEQVDAVLEALADEITRLETELGDARRKPVISTTNQSPE